MSLTDIMSGGGLSIYADVALILFLAAFVGIVVRTFAPSNKAELDAASQLPFDEGHASPRPAAER